MRGTNPSAACGIPAAATRTKFVPSFIADSSQSGNGCGCVLPAAAVCTSDWTVLAVAAAGVAPADGSGAFGVPGPAAVPAAFGVAGLAEVLTAFGAAGPAALPGVLGAVGSGGLVAEPEVAEVLGCGTAASHVG